jgi:hypothetical protein
MVQACLKIKLDFLSERRQEFLWLKEEIIKVNRNSGKYFQILQRMIELEIEINGHAWCMDVEKERKKMASLITGLLRKV